MHEDSTAVSPLDEAIISRMLAGDDRAFRQVVTCLVTPLSRYIHRVIGNQADAGGAEVEDIVQETFIKLWLNREKYDPARASLKTWVYQMARNLAIDHLRRIGSRPAGYSDSLDDETRESRIEESIAAGARDEATEDSREESAKDSTEEMGDKKNAQWQQLGQLLLQLPESQRSAIALYHLQGFSNKETAQILGTSLEALESLLARGRRSLQKLAPKRETEGKETESKQTR